MAITPVTTRVAGFCSLTLWEALVTTTDHTGLPVSIPGAADRTVQVIGTFGGATVIIEGSNDGVTWAQCHDATGVLIAFTAAGMNVLLENPLHLRARLSVVGSGADVDVYMLSRTTH